MRDKMSSRSNSLIADRIETTSLPCAVVVSTAVSRSDLKPTPALARRSSQRSKEFCNTIPPKADRPILELLPSPTHRERRHRGLALRLVAVRRRARYAAGGGGGGFGGLGGGGLGGRGGNMATRKVKCVLVVVISVLFCPNLPRPARQRGRAWEAATTAAAAKAAANNS